MKSAFSFVFPLFRIMASRLSRILVAGVFLAGMATHLLPAAESSHARWYQGDREGVIQDLSRLLEESPQDQELRLSLLVLLCEAGERTRALEVAADLEAPYEEERLLVELLLGASDPDLPFSGPGPGPGSESESEAESASASGSCDNGTGQCFFLEGLGAFLAGRTGEAREALQKAVTREEHLPYGYFLLGQIFLDNLEWTSAAEAFRTALGQDANLTAAFKPLALADYARGERAQAYERLQRAALSLPWSEEIREVLARWEEAHPELLVARQADVQKRRSIAEPPRVATRQDELLEIPRIRVALAEGLRSVYLKAGGDFRIVRVPSDLVYYPAAERLEILQELLAEDPLARGAEGMVLEISLDPAEGVLVLQEEGAGEPLLRAAGPLRLVYDDPGSTTIVFDLAYGKGQFSAGREDRSYRGDMELFPRPDEGRGEFSLINDLDVEEYLFSVVPSEMPAWWPEEALKAQAVAARSYTLHRRSRFHHRGFDLQSSVISAYYRGVAGEHPRTTRAVEKTEGYVLARGGRVIDAVYSANSAGFTESSESVWGSVTSLVSVVDPHFSFDEDYRSPGQVFRWIRSRPESYSSHPDYASASAYRWTLAVSRQEIEARSAAAGADIGSLLRVLPGSRGRSGRVEAVRLVGTRGETEVRRDAIRSRLGGLRSNLFVVIPFFFSSSVDGSEGAGSFGSDEEDLLPEYFVFQGAGWGHGVGLCQTGSAGFAARGGSFREILAHYYPENELTRWYGGDHAREGSGGAD
ncbi:SpoIID/LytB domain protein [Alkalispirochaeta americana]|uniref:SpoIID/LytB domain protein n=1 Tax=Alkalispirochaeta americana TaxID=159291 RepID=A0A1N6UWG2_9SPIO|nr:SpoIID/LytB domain-containing protein [Alkalispirochaeta americana]SIQ69973.1 SpoIID/LytB domain protein [Alkalispirochaeta americana]